MADQELKLLKKPFASVVDKSFRHNVLENAVFPDEPTQGWMLPQNWIEKCNDIVRCTLTTKYIDGPEFLSKELEKHLNECGLGCEYRSRENDRGYYAYHFYAYVPMDIPNLDFSTTRIDFSFEIQLTTQLQEVMRQLTHGLYEELRLQAEPDQRSWKWDFESPRFQASYLGHTLHLLEGLIVQLKQKSASRGGQSAAAVSEAGPDQNTLAENGSEVLPQQLLGTEKKT
jgi:hypothetical protein